MLKYIALFFIAFLLGLAWLFHDNWLPKDAGTQTLSSNSNAPVERTVQPATPALTTTPHHTQATAAQPAVTSSAVAQQETAPNTQVTPNLHSTTETQANPQQAASTAEPFSADEPYIPPEQRRAGHLGGPPPRSMMLNNPQAAY